MHPNDKIEQQKRTIDNLVLELAAERQRADMLLEQGKLAAAQVQSEQQRIAALGEELAAAKAAIPAQTGMPGIRQLAAQLDADEKWTVVEQQAFAPFLKQFPNEGSQGIISLGSAWKHGVAYGLSLQPVQQPAPVASIGSHKPFELAAKALYSNWTPEKVNHLIATADAYVAQHAAPVAAPVAMPAASVQPDAEAYSDMLREFFCQYAAGGYNDDGGLVPLDKCRDKLEWIIKDQRAHAAQPVDKGSQAEQAEAWYAVVDALNEHSFGWQQLTNRGIDSAVEAIRLMATKKPDSGRDAALAKLVRYGFDGTLGGDFSECDKGPYWMVADVERALAARPANVAQVGELSDAQALVMPEDITKDDALWRAGCKAFRKALNEMTGQDGYVVKETYIALRSHILAAAKKGGA